MPNLLPLSANRPPICSSSCISTKQLLHNQGHIVALALHHHHVAPTAAASAATNSQQQQQQQQQQQLYSASHDGTIRAWTSDLSTCSPLNSAAASSSSVASSSATVKAFVVHKNQIFTAHHDNKIRVWSRGSRKKLATLPTVRDYLKNFISANNYVQVRRGQNKRMWMEHVDSVSALAFGNDNFLYSGSWDKTIKVWNLSTFSCVESFTAHQDAVSAMVLGSPDGLLYTGSADSTIKVWRRRERLNKHSLITSFKADAIAVNALALDQSEEGSLLYSGGSDGSVKVWRWSKGLDSMCCVDSLHGHRQAVLCIATTEGGEGIVFSGSADKSIRVWKRGGSKSTRHTCIAVMEGHNGPVKCLVASYTTTDCATKAKNFVIYSGSLDCTIKMWFVCVHDEKEGDTDCAGNREEIEETQTVLIQSFHSWWWRMFS